MVSHSILAIVSAVIAESHLEYCQAVRLGTENGEVFLLVLNHLNALMILMAVVYKDILIDERCYYFQKLNEQQVQIHQSYASVYCGNH